MGLRQFFNILLTVVLGLAVFAGAPKPWEYDAGPDRNTEMGKELIELNANIPNFPGVSKEIMGKKQKFRPAWGPISWRMNLKPNTIKILFIGQDGTHIAEAAGRPATAGFGGRAQSLANHFGVNYSAAFINTYAFTIQGQYAVFAPPIEVTGKDGKQFITYRLKDLYDDPKMSSHARPNIVDNQTWAMSQALDSPITQWRNNLIDWIIRNNQESLKLIVTFGGSANDSIGSFILSRGGSIASKFPPARMKHIRVPLIRMERAGGNNVFPVPITAEGNDIYRILFEAETGKKPNYKPPFKGKGDPDNQDEVKDLLVEKYEEAKNLMVYANGGEGGSGLLTAAQVNGYDLEQIQVPGVVPARDSSGDKLALINIKGLKLNGGQKVKNDVLIVELPHPTALTNTKRDQDKRQERYMRNKGYVKSDGRLDYSKCYDDKSCPKSGVVLVGDRVEWQLRGVKDWRDHAGWFIAPDFEKDKQPYEANFFVEKDEQGSVVRRPQPYKYGRNSIPHTQYDFGTPGNRMVNVSSANRIGPNTILLGARKTNFFRGKAGKAIIKDLQNGTPAQRPDDNEMYISISRLPETREIFDAGPSEKFAKLMKDNLNLKEIFAVKRDESGKKMVISKYDSEMEGQVPVDGVNALNVKTFPDVADFGHYRGTFENPEVVVLADPHGWDSIMTARALTGLRGQMLQGLMRAAGVPVNYLVFKTVPFGMETATDEEWETVLGQTEEYRDKVLAEVLKQVDEKGQLTTKLLMTDGRWARKELKRFLNSDAGTEFADIKVVDVPRSNNLPVYSDILDKRKMTLEQLFTQDMMNARLELANAGYPAAMDYFGERVNIPSEHLSYYARVWEGTSGDRVATALTVEGGRGQAFVQSVPKWVTKQPYTLSEPTQESNDELLTWMCEAVVPMPWEITKPEIYLNRLERSAGEPECPIHN